MIRTSFLQSVGSVLTVLVLVLLLGSHQSSSQQVCPVGWVKNSSSCYYIYNNTSQKLAFWPARQWCGEHADLTSVLSQEEDDFLKFLINKTHLRPNETFYIGLRRNTSNDPWEWVRNEPYNYTNWFQGQEPPPVGQGQGKNCAFYNQGHQWELEDACGKERLFICKKQQQQTTVCPVGWVKNGSSCYYIYNNTSQKLAFWPARQWCRQHSADLTSVLSQEEDDFLNFLINKTHLRRNETFYIGLRRKTNNDPWEWVKNEPYNYTNWFQGQEPPPPGQGQGRICAFYNQGHQWELEEACGTKRLFICKKQQQQQQGQPTGNETVQTPRPGIISSSSITTTSTITTTTLITVSNSTQHNQPDETFNKLNELLSSLEGASFNDSLAEKYMKELGAVLGSVLDSSPPGQKSVAELGKVVEMGEKIGKLIVSGLKRGGNITEPKNVQIKTDSLVLGVDILPLALTKNSATSVSFPEDDNQTNKIKLPASLIWKAQQSDGVSITNLLLSNVGESSDPKAKRVLDSGIISSTILFNNGSKFGNLSEPVVIKLSAVHKVNPQDPKICSFLDIKTNPPSWSSTGCVVHYQDPSYTECHCYHMTSFAVLMDVHGAFESDAISEKDQLVLSTISIVGCLIAFVCYIILLCVFVFLRKRTETSSIHMNLAAAEIFATFFFLVAYPAVGIKEACFAIAILLYYFQLASFCWMLVEGINLLRGLVKVFRITSRLRIYCLFAWGLPAIVVTVTAGIFHHQYLRENFCWLSHGLIWAFAGPVACILVVNLTVLVVAIRIVVRRARYKVKPKEKPAMTSLQLEIRVAFKTIVILMPMLGVTWLLGFISIHEDSLVFQYLFAVINSMQGVYFLISQYCFDDDIKRNAHHASIRMKRLFSLSSTKSSSSRSSSARRKSGTLSADRKASLAMKPNLVSPQQSTLFPKMTGDQRGSGDTFREQGDEEQPNKDRNIVYRLPSIEDQGHEEDKFDFPQLSGEDLQRCERGVVSPQSSIEVEHETNEKSLFTHQQSTAEQTTVDQEQNNEEALIDPQESTAVEQNEEQLAQNSDVTSGVPEQNNTDDVEQDNNGKDIGFSQQMSANQRENNEIQGKNTKNFVSPKVEEQDEQDYEDISSSHQNDSDLSEQINEEKLVSPRLANHCADQPEDHNNIRDTRF